MNTSVSDRASAGAKASRRPPLHIARCFYLAPVQLRRWLGVRPQGARYFLHLGLHKTGSTSVQQWLTRNKVALARHQTLLLRYGQLQPEFTRQHIHNADTAAARKWLGSRLSGYRQAILSNEDFLGGYCDFHEGMVYPRHSERLDTLTSSLPPAKHIRVWLAVRDYPDWLESCYLQFLKYRAQEPVSFENYLAGIDTSRLDWTAIARKILSSDSVEHLTIWTYESFCRDKNPILHAIQTDLGIDLPEPLPRHAANPSYSDLAHRLLMHSGGMKPEHRSAFGDFLRGHLTTEAGYAKPRLWQEPERSALSARYHADLASLASLVSSKFTFLG